MARKASRRSLAAKAIGTKNSGKSKGAARRSIEAKLKKLAAAVPQHEWDRLPKDASENLDHYLYGAPKRR